MIVTTVALPPELHRRLVLAAIDEKAAAAELVRLSLKEWLDKHHPAPKKKG